MKYPVRSARRVAATIALLLFFGGLAARMPADPQTKQLEVDFGRDVASRDLKGLATRSDGRILPGPEFTDLDGPKVAEILWTLKPSGPYRFVVGTGPDGKVLEVTVNPKDNSYSVKELADLVETQAIAVQPLADGSLLVGTSPTAAIYLVTGGKVVARVPLPADSVFAFLPLPDGTVLAGTGNPGKIYRLDLKQVAKAGLIEGKAGDDKLLAAKGVTLFGEIRDRNIRTLARVADGRIVAGSSPRGNVYGFAAAGGAPVILQENRDAEVVDLLPVEDGGFYAAIVSTPGDAVRVGRTTELKDDTKEKDKEPKPAFMGRSSIVYFPADGFPETVFAKPNISLYRMARYRGWLLLTAGEQGDAFAYDPVARRSLTFAGSASAQLNDLAPLDDGRFLLIRNNAPGLAVLSFAPPAVRELETKRLDLGQAAEFGAFRFARLRGVDLGAIKVEVCTNYGSDEIEGWTPWTEMKVRDDGFYAPGLRGRYARFRLKIAAPAADFQIDKATLYSMPQDRRPTLADFRIFAPNLGLVPAPESPPSVTSTLGQVLFPGVRDSKDDAADKRKGSLMGSQVVPEPGTQVVYWNVNDPDGDNLTYTFSIRPENSGAWTDLTVDSTDSYVQFEISGLPEGLYLTRLAVKEQAPRPAAQRLSYTFETDTLLVDHTPPVVTGTQVQRTGGLLLLSVDGRDALSLLEGAEFVLNNGARATVTLPADGILDGKEERFTAEIPEGQASGATSVEIILYDQSGNAQSTRVPLK